MDKLKISIIILVVVVGAFSLYFVGNREIPMLNQNSSGNSNNSNEETVNQQGSVSSTSSNLYFTIAANDLPYGDIGSVSIAIDKVQVHSQTNNWITLSQSSQTFNLSDLVKNYQSLLLAKGLVTSNKYQVFTNTYDEFRLHIAKVTVASPSGNKTAVLPSNYFDVRITGLPVYSKTSSALQISFDVRRSLHQTDKGEFIFAPTLTVDSRIKATVQVGKNNVTTVSFGETRAGVNFGMDIDGKIKTDFIVDPNAKLTLVGGTIQIVK